MLSIFLFLIIITIAWLIAFTTSIWVGLVLIIWTIASITWFITNLGDKYRTEKWYDWVLSPPVLGIAWLFAFLKRNLETYENRKSK